MQIFHLLPFLTNRLSGLYGSTKTVNILFASLVGPPLNEFCPLPFVKKWLLNHRAAADNQSKKIRYTDTADMRYGHMMSVFL